MTPLLLLPLLLTLTTANTPHPTPRSISVTGDASVAAEPDIATLTTEVVTLAPTAQAALTRNNRLTSALFDTLSEFNVSRRDIQTTSFSVSPRFQRPDNSDVTRIIGYTVRNSLRVTVRDLSNLGLILDALVRAGSNSLSRISFGISNEADLRDQARELAVKDAVQRATLLTDAAGTGLGKVLSIRESGGFARGFSTTLAAASISEVPISPGESQVSASVTLEFELVG